MKGYCRLKMGFGPDDKDYTCDEMRQLHLYFKERYRIENKSESVEKMLGKDKAYIEYASAIDEFLANCKCESEKDKIYREKMESMSVVDRILFAKEERKNGYSPWNT